MSVKLEEGEVVKKKTVVAIFFTLKQRYISRFFVTTQRIIALNQKKELLYLSFENIHEISVVDRYKVSIRCNTPLRFFSEKEEYIRLNFYALQKKEGNVIAPREDPKWAKAWVNYLNKLVKEYQEEIIRKKHELQNEEDELLLIEGIQRGSEGLLPFENVKTKEKVNIWFDNNEMNICTMYATNTRILIKIKSGDYVEIPYSLIYTYKRDDSGCLGINLSFPQVIEGFDSEISKVLIKRIPSPDEDYPKVYENRWFEEWEEFFGQILTMFKKKKGTISPDEMLDMLVEMKHSPTKYNLSDYAKQGWDRACGLALTKFQDQMDDLYLYINFLLQEYEDMKNRALAEPDPARQEAYSGSENAYNAILAYINQHTHVR